MTAAQKLASVERQITEIEKGAVMEIHCPYCGEVSSEDKWGLCCEKLAEAAHAILDRKDLDDQIREIDQIREGNERKKRQLFDKQVTLN